MEARHKRDVDLVAKHFGTCKATRARPNVVETPEFDELSSIVKNTARAIDNLALGTYIGVCLPEGDVRVVSQVFECHEIGPLLRVQYEVPTIHPRNATVYEMQALPRDRHDRLMDVIRAHQEVLLPPNAVAAFPCACTYVGGTKHEQECIRVTVWAKNIVPLGAWVIPPVVDGVRVDVVSGAPAFPQTKEYDPDSLVASVSARNLHPGSGLATTMRDGLVCNGTFAALVDKGQQLFGLTAGHTLNHPCKDVRSCYKSVCNFGSDLVGTTSEVSPIVDAGIFVCDLRVTFQTQLNPALAPVWRKTFGSSLPTLRRARGRDMPFGTTVFKHGLGSGLTDGTVNLSGMSRCADDVSEVLFIKNKTFAKFSEKGDSGALVFTEDGDVVGMVTSANLDYSVVVFVEDIEAALGVELVF